VQYNLHTKKLKHVPKESFLLNLFSFSIASSTATLIFVCLSHELKIYGLLGTYLAHGTMSSILSSIRTHSVAKDKALVVTKSGWSTFSSFMLEMEPLRTLMP